MILFIKRELYQKYLRVDKDFSKKPNLIRLPYVSYPIYEQNYLLADIVSWQIHEYLCREYGGTYGMDPRVGEFLMEKLWKDGELYSWPIRIQKAIGKELDLKGYLKYFLE